MKISRNRYKLMKICINIPINIKIRAYFAVKYHTFVVNIGKYMHKYVEISRNIHENM